MSVVDWDSKMEPWRSIGLRFVGELEKMSPARPPPSPPSRPFQLATQTAGTTPGQRITNYRLRLGWSEQMLAERCGMSREGIIHIRKSQSSARTSSRIKLAKALGVEVADIWPTENMD